MKEHYFCFHVGSHSSCSWRRHLWHHVTKLACAAQFPYFPFSCWREAHRAEEIGMILDRRRRYSVTNKGKVLGDHKRRRHRSQNSFQWLYMKERTSRIGEQGRSKGDWKGQAGRLAGCVAAAVMLQYQYNSQMLLAPFLKVPIPPACQLASQPRCH